MSKLAFEPIQAPFTDVHKDFYKSRKSTKNLYKNEVGEPWAVEQFRDWPLVIEVHNPGGKLPTLSIEELNPLQGDLKEFLEHRFYKLKASLMVFGFAFPFFVWIDPKDGTKYVVDGHGRRILLSAIPAYDKKGNLITEFPYVEIYAKDKTDAKERLLAATSQYQSITQDGYEGFVYELDPFIASYTAFDGIYEITDDKKEKGPSNKAPIKGPLDTEHQCPKCGFEF